MTNRTPDYGPAVAAGEGPPDVATTSPRPAAGPAAGKTVRMISVTLFGFSSGLPLVLTAGTLQAWMTDAGVAVGTIGAISLIGMPYSVKFLWSPLVDRFKIPALGHRKGWLLASQLLTAASLVVMSWADPVGSLALLLGAAFAVAFFSATQDIVIDAYRTELLPPAERGMGAGLFVFGYRLAVLTSGALVLRLADLGSSWPTLYRWMALLMAIGGVITLAAPEHAGTAVRPKSLAEAVTAPLKDLLWRRGAAEILAFVVLYKLGDVLATSLTTTFLMQTGFSKSEIASGNKVFGLVSVIVGGIVGGTLIPRLGLGRALVHFGILQSVSILPFALLAVAGPSYPLMAATMVIENLAAGMGTSALVAFLMSLCRAELSATQYAVLSSIMSLPRVLLAAPTGYLQQATGWPAFFLICFACSLPGMALVTFRFRKWNTEAA